MKDEEVSKNQKCLIRCNGKSDLLCQNGTDMNVDLISSAVSNG